MLPIRLNPEILFQSWRAQKKKALKEIQVIRDRLSQFENQGSDLYREWLHQTFPGILTHIRTTCDASSEIEQIIHAIRFEAKWGGLKKNRAYEVVIERKANCLPLISEEARVNEREATAKEHAEFEKVREQVRDGTLDETEKMSLREEFRHYLYEEIGVRAFLLSDEDLDRMITDGYREEEDCESDESDTNRNRPPPVRLRSSSDEENSKSLKTIYRELARRLHPDVNGGKMSASDRRLWHEVQSAYEREDVGRLSALRAFVMEGEREADESKEEETSLSSLITLVQSLKATLRDLRSSERRLQKDVAFLFFKKRDSQKKLQPLALKIQTELQSELAEAQYRLQHWKLQLKRFAKTQAKHESKRPKKR